MDINESGVLGSCVGRGKMDLATYYLTVPEESKDPRLSAFDYHMLAMHENSHWVRFHATTCGMALTAMKFASERLVHDLVLSAAPRTLAELAEKRRSGRRIFDLLDGGSGIPHELELTRQMWLDLRVAYATLFDFDNDETLAWPIMSAVESAVTDIDFWAQRFHDRAPGRPILRPVVGESKIGFVKYEDIHITTRLLFECAATIDQLFSWGADIDGGLFRFIEGGYTSQLDDILTSEYAAPLDLLCMLTEFRGRDAHVPMLTAVALIDFALNPRVPPFIDVNAETLPEWEDLYPPARFVRACKAAKHVGLIDTVLTAAELADYRARIAEVAGMTSPDEYLDPFARRWKTQNVFALSDDVGSNPATDYIGYLTWVHSKFWELRKTAEPLVVFYGTNTISQSREAVHYLLGQAGMGWFNAPFHWTSSGTLGSDPDVGSTVATKYSVSLAYYLTLHDLVSRSGPLSKRQFPPDSYELGFWESIKNRIDDIFGASVW